MPSFDLQKLAEAVKNGVKDQFNQGAPYRQALASALQGDLKPADTLFNTPQPVNPNEAVDTAMAFSPMGLGTIKGGNIANQLNLLHPNVDAHLIERPSGITLSSIKVAPELRGNGYGQAFMQDLITSAGKENKTIALSPSSDFGGNKARLQNWYKELGFLENKGKNKDYEISESMYKPPPSGNE